MSMVQIPVVDKSKKASYLCLLLVPTLFQSTISFFSHIYIPFSFRHIYITFIIISTNRSIVHFSWYKRKRHQDIKLQAHQNELKVTVFQLQNQKKSFQLPAADTICNYLLPHSAGWLSKGVSDSISRLSKCLMDRECPPDTHLFKNMLH